MTNTPCEQYRREQEALERQRKRQEQLEQSKDHTFINLMLQKLAEAEAR